MSDAQFSASQQAYCYICNNSLAISFPFCFWFCFFLLSAVRLFCSLLLALVASFSSQLLGRSIFSLYITIHGPIELLAARSRRPKVRPCPWFSLRLVSCFISDFWCEIKYLDVALQGMILRIRGIERSLLQDHTLCQKTNKQLITTNDNKRK